jgi:hypothetical protein
VAPPFRFGTGAAFGVCAVSRDLLFSGHSPANRPVTVFVSRSQILAEFRKKVPRILALFDAFRKSIFLRKKAGTLLRKDWLPGATGALIVL